MDLAQLQHYFTDGTLYLLIGSIALLILAVGLKATRKNNVEVAEGPDLRWWRADRRFATQYDM